MGFHARTGAVEPWIIGVYRLSQSKHTILATSDASLAAPALGIYVASIHIFMLTMDGRPELLVAAHSRLVFYRGYPFYDRVHGIR
jgi:hypothetical protein